MRFTLAEPFTPFLTNMAMFTAYVVSPTAMKKGLGQKPAPVPVGRRVRGTFQLVSADEVAGAVQLTLDVVVEVEGQDRPACVARSMWRHYPASLVGR